jgi:bifunctional oligoribonuclease and PAP phosphatase NrnA
MRKDTAARFKALLKNSRRAVIVTHFNPDGDAMGSSLGLWHLLRKAGKKATVIVPNACPDFLTWLPGTVSVLDYSASPDKVSLAVRKSDLIFALDFNAFKRLEKLGELLEASAAPKVLIDHHPAPEKFASAWYHDEKACSTSELVYELAVKLGWKKHLDKKSAACLYTGLMTDSGSFRYPCVTSNTHLTLAGLLGTGIVPADIHSAVYDSYSADRLRLLGHALKDKMVLVDGLPVAYISLTTKELNAFNFQKGDTEGLVNYPFMIKGVQLCALFTESPEYVRISFRSKGKTDVNGFSRAYFNGGGHTNAAGGKSFDSMDVTIGRFLDKVKTLF